MPQRVLVVDDESAIVELVAYNLGREGFDVLTESDGERGLKRALAEKPDLIVLDVMLPGLSGMDVCRSIRKETDIPVIMLTARKDELDRVLGLELGADDYVTKPFSPRELVARVKAILRRAKRPRDKETEESGDIERNGLRLELDKREALLDNKPLHLTFTEFELLAILARNPGRAFTRDDLLVRVWGQDFFGDARTVDVHIRHLREKLQEDPQAPRFIETVRGVGYRFKELSNAPS
ncbi:winged helix-turn-helix domain-containing protein [Sulfobacillus sp. hq2]|uniref:Stage 0 sporulation protein A homolog n=1 Tax=Sulfobacillus thermotolerans TaxID=338644 RepID=A0ABM6RNY0_9FIRM|nr:response regulator transcription factor [Sulfobacillus sp. hq2]AUW93025.1 DNA-binding response regulator [Sulfobacillus thermotolerans]POB11109.1 DNA-binding response regulator [Sulfobacillus sp. hq2]